MSSEARKEIAERELAARAETRCRVAVCQAAGCLSSGAGAVRDALKRAVGEAGIDKEVEVFGTGCLGLCHAGPLVQVEVQGAPPLLYEGVDGGAAARIVTEHV